jgi:hypothetical protein
MIPTEQWEKRNIWYNDTNEMAVRDGFQLGKSCSEIAEGEFFGGFSIRNPRTGDVSHYVLIKGVRCTISLLDEEFNPLYQLDLGKNLVPSGPLQGGLLANGQLLFGAPGIPTMWGYVGSGFKPAEKTESSQDIDFDTLDIPDGLIASWQGRIVIGVRDALFFSDVLSPRAFLAANAVNAPGIVYFLQVSADGRLYVGTSKGMYTLAADSVYSGEILQPVYQKVSEYPINSYFQTCLTLKGPVSLCKYGVMDTGNFGGIELKMNGGRMTRALSEPAHYSDYRVGKIFGMSTGPIVSMQPAIGRNQSRNSTPVNGNTNLMAMIDERAGIFSWMEPALTRNQNGFQKTRFGPSFDVRAVLEDSDGREFLVCRDNIITMYGNTDEFLTSRTIDQPKGLIYRPFDGAYIMGVVSSKVPSPPEANPVVRYVTVASDNIGTYQYAVVRGEVKRALPNRVAQRENFPVCDQDIKWYDVAPTAMTEKYYEKTLVSTKFNFSQRTQDPDIEFGVEGSGYRVGNINIETRGPGKFRKVDGITKTYNQIG